MDNTQAYQENSWLP